MRMGREGPSAAEIINTLSEKELKQVIAVFGEERRAHAIARAIAKARTDKPFTRTGELARLVESGLGRRPQDPIHPATRTFQALRIYVNRELEELVLGLAAAEKILRPGGRLAVVTFHSLEDRIVKRFIAERSGRQALPSRHLPAAKRALPSFAPIGKQPARPSAREVAANPRARSAKLRSATRIDAAPHPIGEGLMDLALARGAG
jgi:16S rRNA (cytosine1402-N4)-methyltransferase